MTTRILPIGGTGGTANVTVTTYLDSGGFDHIPSPNEYLDGGGLAVPVTAALPLPTNHPDFTTGPSNVTTAAQTVAISTLIGGGTIGIDISGSGSGYVLIPEAQIDGSNWFTVNSVYDYSVNSPNTNAQITANGRYVVSVPGCNAFRVRVSSITSGTVTVFLRASVTPSATQIVSQLPTGGNLIGRLTANQSVNVTQFAGTGAVLGHGVAASALRVELPTDGTGVVGLNAGANLVGKVGIDQTTPGTTNLVASELSTGLTTFENTALSNTKTAVKAGAGKVYGWMIHNPSAATTFIQVWNVAIGSITVGTTAPTWVIGIPAGASANVFTDRGITHSTEINIAATTTATGSTAPATAAVVGIFYI